MTNKIIKVTFHWGEIPITYMIQVDEYIYTIYGDQWRIHYNVKNNDIVKEKENLVFVKGGEYTDDENLDTTLPRIVVGNKIKKDYEYYKSNEFSFDNILFENVKENDVKIDVVKDIVDFEIKLRDDKRKEEIEIVDQFLKEESGKSQKGQGRVSKFDKIKEKEKIKKEKEKEKLRKQKEKEKEKEKLRKQKEKEKEKEKLRKQKQKEKEKIKKEKEKEKLRKQKEKEKIKEQKVKEKLRKEKEKTHNIDR